ncbi:hypothetical protein TNCV_2661931 [Trichonephila clavipes]|nr:hypothetical protein TNCV_2661931 [Trichonephila clavipes]
MERQYQKKLPPQGGGQWRKKPDKNETGVTSRGRKWKSAGRRRKDQKRVRGAPKRNRENELLLFFFAARVKKIESETGSMTRSSAPYLETTIFLVLLACFVGGGMALLRQWSMGVAGFGYWD